MWLLALVISLAGVALVYKKEGAEAAKPLAFLLGCCVLAAILFPFPALIAIIGLIICFAFGGSRSEKQEKAFFAEFSESEPVKRQIERLNAYQKLRFPADITYTVYNNSLRVFAISLRVVGAGQKCEAILETGAYKEWSEYLWGNETLVPSFFNCEDLKREGKDAICDVGVEFFQNCLEDKYNEYLHSTTDTERERLRNYINTKILSSFAQNIRTRVPNVRVEETGSSVTVTLKYKGLP